MSTVCRQCFSTRPGHNSSYARSENSEGAKPTWRKRCAAARVTDTGKNLVDAKPVLRKIIQISQPSPYWHCRLVFQLAKVTGMHSIQAGYLEKAQKYTDKSLMQLEKLKNDEKPGAVDVDCDQHGQCLHLGCNRHQEVHSLLERIDPDHNFPVSSPCLRAAAFYIRGLLSFLPGTLRGQKMSNAEDLNKLTACSLVLLGHIFFVLGNHRESSNMVDCAMQLASKIPHVSVQLWSSTLLKDLNKACRNAMAAHKEAQMHQNFIKQLQQGHIVSPQPP